jgi:general secretion pathway protein I
MTSRRGFTLLEVLVATTIMGIAVVTLMSGLSISVRNASRLTDYDRAALLARAKMGGARGGWRARLTPFQSKPGAPPQALGLDRLQLEIWWMAGDHRRTFNLEAYRRALALP